MVQRRGEYSRSGKAGDEQGRPPTSSRGGEGRRRDQEGEETKGGGGRVRFTGEETKGRRQG
eukprot:766511-Hanusia_phi.AAC.5